MIKLCNVSFRYSRNGKDVLSEVHLEIPRGLTLLVGPNGAGKTTLLSLLSGAAQPRGGTIEFPHGDFRVTSMPQVIRPIRGFSTSDQLEYYGWLHGYSRERRRRRSTELLKTVNLAEQAATKAAHLSGGQLRRLGFAQALISHPHLLLLDEPTAGLDVIEAERVASLILANPEDTPYRIVSTHDLREISTRFDHIVVFAGSERIYSNSVAEFLALTDERDAVASYKFLQRS